MSMTYSSTSTSGEAATYGGFVDALGGIAAIVLAIVGLSGVHPEVLVSIATIVFGAALLIQGGAMLSEFALDMSPEGSSAASGGGVSALFLVGVAGIVLGVLALLGVHAPTLTSVALIAFGAALAISASSVWHLLTSRSVAMQFQGRPAMLRALASEVAAGSAIMQGAGGLTVIVLGILAVCGVFTVPLTLIGLLVAGASILLTGSTLSGTMVGFMRTNTVTAAPSRPIA
jgi:hypothetical protein